MAAAFQVEDGTKHSTLDSLWNLGKVGIKYGLIMGYVWLLFRKVQQYFKGRKVKRG